MEANRKRKGSKGKLMMSLYRALKPSTVQVSSKVKPTPSSSSTVSLGYDGANQKASFTKEEGVDSSVGGAAGGNFANEDSIDRRAAAYISCVQERFKLEQIECERKKYY